MAAPLESAPMPASRHRQRLASWIALLALVLGALAPTLSRAMAWAASDTLPFGVVCSADPDARAPGVAAAEPGTGQHHASVFEHCPFCSIHAPDLALPPRAAVMLPLQGLAAAEPELFLRAPRTLHAWASAQPRAPPLSC